MNISFGVVGFGVNLNGKNWVGKDLIVIVGVNVDISKDGNLLNFWGMELGWIVVELVVVQQVGCLIDIQKYDGMQFKWQMDNDEQVYVGDEVFGLKGLMNFVGVMLNNVMKIWVNFINDEIFDSVNSILLNLWVVFGYFVVFFDLCILLEQYLLLVSCKVFEVGNQLLLIYLVVNIIVFYQNGVLLEIKVVKWLKGCRVGGKDCMVVYINDKKYVCYLLVLL